ncbi:sodium/glutamate symporter [Ignatzschineria cameli]|uniref:Sodium/glutamate symporter n=1 Tax=Ignatzschineria cameli TaxID=2182793 RepID=A0A2U2ALG6_9GAMM|nr:sodium/glutamate symporter [Ignatzschineria cameli]PWD84035.1 sodium/glutamate symporter [Ignatzschineria cameli]PWD89043.1 sodium/glutamate symporter [Ignatzschineria cameli]PWD90148.1 sodium/glutamate symporter [Ignatzschineria cameli]PWD90811.1 sodium/glutamate symporter [Ignatzschineria cameli]
MISFDVYATIVIACLTLLLGRIVVAKIPLLDRFTIPSPVAGGLIIAFTILILKTVFDFEIKFDTALQTPLMLMFFATIGLNANFKSLLSGGLSLLIFLVVVIIFLLIQSGVGIGLAKALGIDPLMGLLAGSVTLAGGHGTGAAWGEVFSKEYGFTNATEIAMACATFGLVLGGLVGGPVARMLLRKRQMTLDTTIMGKDQDKEASDNITAFEQPRASRRITSNALLETITMILISITLGTIISDALNGTKFALPTFVCVLFVGVIINNVLSLISDQIIFERSVSIVGNVSLSLFLAMALMSLKLWELKSLAIPMLIILTVQAIIMALYAVFITYNAMGRGLDGAVFAAGHCGFGLGATPTAIANMQAVTERFGPSTKAFLVVPMVGAFFIDIVNAIVIKLYLMTPLFPQVASAAVGG